MSSWIEEAEEFKCLSVGTRGKYVNLSRMIDVSDVSKLQTSAFVSAYRPRGILSGFLVIHPQLQYAVFMPSPSQTKQHPVRFHIRITPSILEHGLVALAYLYNKQLVVEDLISAGGCAVFQTLPFVERWKRLKEILERDFRNDVFLQDGITITTTTYFPLSELVEPPPEKVVEFVACNETGPTHKRLLWIPSRDSTTTNPLAAAVGTQGGSTYNAKREAAMGPDVYSLYDGDKKLGIALVRTLVASKALRLAFVTASGADATVRVNTVWNKQFDKWEILDVPA